MLLGAFHHRGHEDHEEILIRKSGMEDWIETAGKPAKVSANERRSPAAIGGSGETLPE